jgi:hypothetical protein
MYRAMKMNQNIKFLFINFSLVTILSSIVSVGAFAQQTSIFQQASRAPKDYSNLVPPTQYLDSFLGQDKKGPYTLTWKNFNYSPGNPVWISVDNQVLPSASYTLDVAKGEVTFASLIKRTQVVRVSYGYYSELASKNANPTMVAPLTFKLASLGLNNLNITTFNNNAAQDPSFVLGFNSKGNGLTSNLFFAPGQTNAVDQSALKLGYNTGNAKNGLNVDFSRNGKGFAPTYGKAFGINDSLQTLNLNGNITSQVSALSFSRKDSRNLSNNQGGLNQSALLKLGGGRNQPLISYSSNGQEGLDPKGVFNSTSIENGNLTQKFGALDLAYKTNKTDTTIGKSRTLTDQNSINLGLAANAKTRMPGFSFNRTNDSAQAGSATTLTTTDRASLAAGLAGGNLSFNSLQKNITLPDNKVQQIDQRSVNLGFNGNKKGFSGLTFGRIEDDKTDNSNISNTVNNRGSIGGVFAKTTFNLNFNKIDTNVNGKSRLDQDQESILFSLPNSKVLPVAKFTRNDDIKRDAKGVLVGSANDSTDVKAKLSGSDLNYKSTKVDTYTPDGKFTSVDSNLGTLAFKVGSASLNAELLNTNSLVNNSSTLIEQQKYTFNLPGNAKGFSGFKLQRADTSLAVPGLQTDTVANEISYGTKVGPLSLSTNLFKADSVYSNNKVGFADRQNIGINYNTSKYLNFSFNRGGNVGQDVTGLRLGTVNDTYALTSNTPWIQLSVKNLIADVSTPDKRRVFTNTDLYSVKIPSKKNMPGVEVERTDADAEELNAVTNIVSDKLKFNSKLGAANLTASAGQITTDKNNNTPLGVAKDNSLSISTPIWGRGTSVGVTVNNYNAVNGAVSEDKNGLGINITPSRGLTLSTEQQENSIFNSNIQTRSITGQKYSLNYSPAPNATVQTSFLEAIDGVKKSEVYDYRALVGSDKTLFKVDGLLKVRNATDANALLNTDSANATVNINPVKNIVLSGNYLLNPDDPAKAGMFIPVERRQYALTHRAGSFEVTGSYADTEHLRGTSADILAKAGGYYYYGETGLKIGWKAGASTVFTSEYREQFFKGGVAKGSETFSLGLNHTRASTTFSLSGTYIDNRANPNLRTDYRAEAKLGYKF